MSEFNKILCCLCGISIEPNNAAMCTTCLQLEYDITKEIDKVITLIQCSKCNRYHVKQDQWNFYDLESQHLLSFLLKKVPNLSNNNTNKNAIKILNASFIWTEPHSKRLKILLEFQKDIDNNITIKTKVIIEYVIINKQCLDCIREATDHTWGGLIQLRQFCGHKKVFYQLESELLTSKLYNLMINIEIKKDGLDFYFKTKNQADRVVNFINSVLPTKTITSKKLVSANEQSHTAKIEHVIHMEIIPLYKGDLVIIPKEYYGSYELMLVSKMSSSVHLINPVTLETCAITALKFFSKPFVPIMLATKQLIPFVVLDIHPIEPPSGSRVDANCGVLAEAEVARESDLGSNDDTYIVITNLGHILQPGDTALGYDIKNLVLNSESEVLMEKLTHTPPDVILVRKSYPDAKKKRKKRAPRKDKKKRSDNDNSSTASGDDISVATDGNDIGILGFVDDLDADQRQQIYEEEEALLDEERHLLKNNNLNTIEETADEDSNLKQSLEENEDN